jgi:F0F1-type ATP synthase beta subunit
MVLEVQKHMGQNMVRCVAMDTTDGLQRGASVRGTGGTYPGTRRSSTLGRIFNVLGRPIDRLEPCQIRNQLSDPSFSSTICGPNRRELTSLKPG